MNTNNITTKGFSNPESEAVYRQHWKDNAHLRKQHENGQQCGGCSFYAPFNLDYGLCCNSQSKHLTETVFEHFTCSSYVEEGWGPHSFSNNEARHCRCSGRSIYETMEVIITLLGREEIDDEVRSHLRALRDYVDEHKGAST